MNLHKSARLALCCLDFHSDKYSKVCPSGFFSRLAFLPLFCWDGSGNEILLHSGPLQTHLPFRPCTVVNQGQQSLIRHAWWKRGNIDEKTEAENMQLPHKINPKTSVVLSLNLVQCRVAAPVHTRCEQELCMFVLKVKELLGYAQAHLKWKLSTATNWRTEFDCKIIRGYNHTITDWDLGWTRLKSRCYANRTNISDCTDSSENTQRLKFKTVSLCYAISS